MHYDATYDLPTPQDGRLLTELWYEQDDCEYTDLAPVYSLVSTRCSKIFDSYAEFLCGEGVNDAYNTVREAGLLGIQLPALLCGVCDPAGPR